MTAWHPDIQQGWQIGLALIAVLVLFATGISLLAVLNPISILTFLLGLVSLTALVGAVLVGYWLWLLGWHWLLPRHKPH